VAVTTLVGVRVAAAWVAAAGGLVAVGGIVVAVAGGLVAVGGIVVAVAAKVAVAFGCEPLGVAVAV
jgi:hypothetical protein